jgi:copper transporter 1
MSTSDFVLPFEVQAKMDMGSSAVSHKCKISMLWNWYTIDSCFLARSWHVTSRGMFAGTCIGVFFWIIAYCWFHRFIVEYDNAIVEYKEKKYHIDACAACCGNNCGNETTESESSDAVKESDTLANNQITVDTNKDVASPGSDFWTPLKNTFSHKWYLAWMKRKENEIYPSPAEHIGRSGLYLMEWTVSYLIMLMWMYYNGYLIITMILGYFFGQLLFNYTPLTVVSKKDYAAPAHP